MKLMMLSRLSLTNWQEDVNLASTTILVMQCRLYLSFADYKNIPRKGDTMVSTNPDPFQNTDQKLLDQGNIN